MSKWKNVKDELPKKYDRYIVCLKNKSIMEMHYSYPFSIRWFKVGVGEMDVDNPVIFWMNFPNAPVSLVN